MFIALHLAWVFAVFAYSKDYVGVGPGFLVRIVLSMVLLALLGAAIAWLGAVLTLRWHRRA